MATQYQLVETYNASNVSNTPLMDQNIIIVEMPDDPCYRKGVSIGSYVLASTLSQLPGLSKIEKAIINPHKLRQLVSGIHFRFINTTNHLRLSFLLASYVVGPTNDMLCFINFG